MCANLSKYSEHMLSLHVPYSEASNFTTDAV